MYWGSSATSVLIGILGGVLIVCAVVLGRRLGGRRAVGTAGLGLLLVGLTLSGLIDVIARIAFNPLRWVGLGAVAVGFSMLFGSGMLPRRRHKRTGTTKQPEAVESSQGSPQGSPQGSSQGNPQGGSPAVGDGDMDEIEEILRRRGIS